MLDTLKSSATTATTIITSGHYNGRYSCYSNYKGLCDRAAKPSDDRADSKTNRPSRSPDSPKRCPSAQPNASAHQQSAHQSGFCRTGREAYNCPAHDQPFQANVVDGTGRCLSHHLLKMYFINVQFYYTDCRSIFLDFECGPGRSDGRRAGVPARPPREKVD